LFWFWLGLALTLSVPALFSLALTWVYFHLKHKYLHHLVRIFQEKPLFVIPRGQPQPDAEEIDIKAIDGLTLRACYLKTTRQRRGVVWFGLEFGSNRWSCVPYCEHLLENGYDVFACECRGQGDSSPLPNYEPLQWITEFEVADMKAALAYLKGRADADPRGIGFFGISKGAGIGLLVAADDPYVRCFATDGMFATFTVLVPYMRKWFSIYNNWYWLQGLGPSSFYGRLGILGLKLIEAERHCRFTHLEPALPRLSPRPTLMIHGEGDTYIKTDMAEALYRKVPAPKEFWLVEGAKHNQALAVASDEYRRRILAFFNKHLANGDGGQAEPHLSPITPALPSSCAPPS
jgi:pimeloyl-ACP methyl ester carboxylesterase